MRGLWRASLAAALVFLYCRPGLAATYDPKLVWHSAETPHWIIYWYDGEELVADRYFKIVEPLYDRVSKAVDNVPPGKTRLVLTDITDSANGFALTIPYDEITLYVTAPTEGSSLDNYDDWLTMLLTHEFTHICHLSKLGGFSMRTLRDLFGVVVSPNQVAPRWTIEGYATYQETQLTKGGRGRSAFSDMIVRAAVLEKKFPPLDRAVGDTEEWPVGYLPYIFGVEFLEYLRETYGDEKLTLFTRLTGREKFPFFPFWPRFSRHAKQAFGKSFRALWRDWRGSLEKRYGEEKAALEAQGLTPSEKLTHWGGSTGTPRVSPDGKSIVYSMSNGKQYPAIRLMDLDGKHDKVLIDRFTTDGLGWSSDSKVIAFGSEKLWQEFYLWSDIYTWSLDDSVLTRKTRGARGRTPDFKPDGTELTFVTDDVSNSDLNTLKVDESLKWETNQTDGTQWSEPRWRPDGGALAVSTWTPGGFRDIVLVDPKGKLIQRVTGDRFLDRDPSWTADGKYLLFSSDRSGIANIYAWEPATGHYYQVTNVLTGAFYPSVTPDTAWLVYLGYAADGYDVYRAKIDPAKWKQVSWSFDPELKEAGGKAGEGKPRGGPDSPDLLPGMGHALSPGGAAKPEPGYGLAPGIGLGRSVGGPFAPPFARSADAEVLEDDEPGPDVVIANEKITPGGQRPKSRPDKNAGIDMKQYHPGGYHPFGTLLPRYWLPAQLYITESGAVVGAFTGGTDPLFRHSWTAYGNYNTQAGAPGGGFRWYYNRYKPTWYAGVDDFVLDYGQSVYTFPDLTQPGQHVLEVSQTGAHYYEQHLAFQVGGFWLWRQRYFVSARYLFDHRTSYTGLPPFVYQPFIPVEGNFAGPAVALTADKTQWYRYSISPQKGYSLTGTVETDEPFFGSTYQDASGNNIGLHKEIGTLDGRYYLPMPLVPFSVLAFRGVGGDAEGDTIRPSTFRVGGALGESVFTLTTPNYYSLRGYPFFAFGGERLLLGSVEYRAPLWRVNRGITATGPLYVRDVHGAIYMDTGAVWDTGTPLSTQVHTGVGAEIRFDTVWYYFFPLTIRVGYAFALNNDPAGYRPGDINGYVLTLGTSF